MAIGPAARKVRGRLGRLHQTGAADPAEITALETEFWAARAEDHLTEVLAKAPPFTAEQTERLVTILLDSFNARRA